MNTVGGMIRNRRAQLGLTQYQLGVRLGLNTVNDRHCSTVYRWESGRSLPAYKQFKPIANILKIEIGELVSAYFEDIERMIYE